MDQLAQVLPHATASVRKRLHVSFSDEVIQTVPLLQEQREAKASRGLPRAAELVLLHGDEEGSRGWRAV